MHLCALSMSVCFGEIGDKCSASRYYIYFMKVAIGFCVEKDIEKRV